jgi:tripartite-type tricarboxylate transporter receptor subunit TctC
LYQKLPFDTLRDYAPVTLLGSVAFALATHPSIPATSVKQLVALARDKPGKLNFGSSGTGGAPHLAGELFQSMAKVTMLHVPYKGLAPALTDLVAGQLDLIFADLNLVMPQIEAGRLRGIAVSSSKRSSLVPKLPTVAEAGISGYQAGTWYGVLAPVATPRDIVGKLNTDINHILDTREVKERLATQGAEVTQTTPEQFALFIRSELEKWARLVKSANIKLEQ